MTLSFYGETRVMKLKKRKERKTKRERERKRERTSREFTRDRFAARAFVRGLRARNAAHKSGDSYISRDKRRDEDREIFRGRILTTISA